MRVDELIEKLKEESKEYRDAILTVIVQFSKR